MLNDLTAYEMLLGLLPTKTREFMRVWRCHLIGDTSEWVAFQYKYRTDQDWHFMTARVVFQTGEVCFHYDTPRGFRDITESRFHYVVKQFGPQSSSLSVSIGKAERILAKAGYA